MKTPHKHAEVTIAWLQDQSIKLEYTYKGWQGWVDGDEGINPITHPQYEWGIKPEPKPDIVMYCYTDKTRSNRPELYFRSGDNTKLTFDGETGKLKSAEVIS